ncbi:MAG: bifunctional phosphoglucose/phosphomannose isomerase [Candidatus Saccharimonadales bacterium]
MLDDLKLIHERDVQDALGVNEKQWQQLEVVFDVPFTAKEPIQNVVLAGMGGSALSALIVQSWPGVKVPFEISRQYDIPGFVGPNTLFIAYSYSGNTEETLEALTKAQQANAQIVIVAAGGKLEESAKAGGYPFYKLPKVSQPRYAALMGVTALVELLVSAGLLSAESLAELRSQATWLKEKTNAWLPTVPTSDNYAKQIAQEVIGKSVVVYAGPKLAPAAYKWKISFNENAKHVAWWNQYPEFNHNEFLGWTKQPQDKPYCVIDLRSSLEHPRVLKRFEVSERLLSGLRPSPLVVTPEGETLLQQLLYMIALGDFVSLYTALLNGLNPTPVDLIETFKKSLDD